MIDRRRIVSAAWDIWWAKHGGPRVLRERQQKHLQELLDFARAHSPFYHRLYRDLPAHLDRLVDLPPVTKNELMAGFNEWVTDPGIRLDRVRTFIADPARLGTPFLGRYAIWHTSGTTGTPGIFVHDSYALGTYIALLLMRCYLSWTTAHISRRLARQRWRTAFIFATGGHFATNAFETVTRELRPGALQTPPIFSIQQPLPDLVQALNDGQPAILATYPSVLAVLTDEQSCGRLKIRPLLIAAGGECLKPGVRSDAERVFRCKVHNVYAASEFMGIAFDCNHGRLHVNSDWVILEPVDADLRPLTPGSQPYDVLLTNLTNTVQPIIRYRMGDRISFDRDPCPCGNPLPTITVEGRDDEILTFETSDSRASTILPMALEAVVEVIPGVQRFQLVQTGPMTLKVRLETVSGSDEAQVWETVENHLHIFLELQGLLDVHIERSPECPAQHIRSGKFRQVWSEWRPTGVSAVLERSNPIQMRS